jgi:hypothetical protein
MKKSVVDAAPSKLEEGQEWLHLEQLANVEVTSEDPDYPVESVFAENGGQGWRAAKPGRQIITLLFHEPQSIHRIHLEFSETQVARSQEFTLRWGSSADSSLREIVRQQWNFSPQGSTTQVEDYRVNLSGVSILELIVNPDLSGTGAIASLDRWQIA